VNDGDEAARGSDPSNPYDDDPARDRDGDGLRDVDELGLYGTDPDKADTDGGGADDGDEVALGFDPLDPSDDVAVGGCQAGCHTGPGGSPAAALLGLVGLLRRRRGMSTL